MTSCFTCFLCATSFNGAFFSTTLRQQAFRWGLLPAILALTGFVVGLWRLKPQRRLILFLCVWSWSIPLLLQSSICRDLFGRDCRW